MVSLEDIKMLLKQGYSKATSGQKTITTAGTKERITDQHISIAQILIRALTDNTGQIYIIFSETKTGSEGYTLDAGENVTIPIDDLSKIYLDAETNGEGVCFITVGGEKK